MSNHSFCKLLLIEDDLPLASLISQYLRRHKCDLVHVSTGEEVNLLVNLDEFDIVLCDVMLPDTTGFDLFNRLQQKLKCPIIFLTALDEDQDQIRGLELGAVDYLVKPVEPAVLLARIRVQLRTHAMLTEDKKIVLNQLVFDNKLKHVLHHGQTIQLTVQDFEVLYILAQHHLQIVPRETMFKQVIGREYDGLDRAADLIISRLRKKFEELKLDFISIRSIRGKGYLFNCNK